MSNIFASTWAFLKDTFDEFIEDDCATMAASIAYYTVFSLGPLLVLVITVTGFFISQEQAQGQIQQQLSNLIGPDAARQVETMIRQVQQSHAGVLATVLGFLGLVIGATGMLSAIQAALNRTWDVQPDPNQGGVKNFVLKRLLSLAMILVIAFLLLVSLLISTLLAVIGHYAQHLLPAGMSEPFLQALNAVASLVVISLLFAAMFKFLPDAKISWSAVGMGALVTALLFLLGKTLISLYLMYGNPASAYGIAGSLVVILIWVYYTAMIVLYGGEFTQVWARRSGQQIEPVPGAVKVVRRMERAPGGGKPASA
jgi:membrane protein